MRTLAAVILKFSLLKLELEKQELNINAPFDIKVKTEEHKSCFQDKGELDFPSRVKFWDTQKNRNHISKINEILTCHPM